MWFPWKEHGRTSSGRCPLLMAGGLGQNDFQSPFPAHTIPRAFWSLGQNLMDTGKSCLLLCRNWGAEQLPLFKRRWKFVELEVNNGQGIFHLSAPGMNSAERGQLELLPECYRNKLAKLAAAEPLVVTVPERPSAATLTGIQHCLVAFTLGDRYFPASGRAI